LPYVQTNGFGAIGHSLGGHNSIYTAVFDERIKVIVSSCGFDSFQDYMNGNIKGWTSERYMPRLLDYPLSGLPFDFYKSLARWHRVRSLSTPLWATQISNGKASMLFLAKPGKSTLCMARAQTCKSSIPIARTCSVATCRKKPLRCSNRSFVPGNSG